MAARKPISFMIHASRHPEEVHHGWCICDDGSFWSFDTLLYKWVEEPPVPGTERAEELLQPVK